MSSADGAKGRCPLDSRASAAGTKGARSAPLDSRDALHRLSRLRAGRRAYGLPGKFSFFPILYFIFFSLWFQSLRLSKTGLNLRGNRV